MTFLLRPSIAEISLEALKVNVRQIRAMVGPKIKIMPVVKSNAYGLGAIQVARAIESEIDALGVAYVYEGIELRRGGIKCPILVMGGMVEESSVSALIEKNLTLAVGDRETASIVSKVAGRKEAVTKIHIEVDTGMGRLGFPWKEAADEIIRICRLPHIEVEGVFSHLATSEIKDNNYSLEQLKRFLYIMEILEKAGIYIQIKHLANSAAILQYPEMWFDLVRPGLMMYGIYPAGHLKQAISLRFPLTIKTRIIQVRSYEMGESISYGRSFICPDTRRIATIPVGYADGFSRVLSNKVDVLVRDKLAPVVGTICMDMCMIDVTHIPEAKVGDEVILLGGEKAIEMVEKFAGLMGTISYEILTSFGRRVRRVYLDGEGLS